MDDFIQGALILKQLCAALQARDFREVINSQDEDIVMNQIGSMLKDPEGNAKCVI